METKSIHAPTLGSASINTPTPKAKAQLTRTATLRLILKFFSQLSATASIILMREVIPAKRTATKKMIAKN